MPSPRRWAKLEAARLAVVYGVESGKLVRREDSTRTDFIDGPRKLFSGGAGLYSTASDYGRFLQMLLNGGELDGARLLSPRTVALMHENHTVKRVLTDPRAGLVGASYVVVGRQVRWSRQPERRATMR